MGVQTFGAIDVGSFELALKIFQFNGKNSMREIDHLEKRLDLGKETYVQGKIGPQRMDELCRTLKEFKEVMDSYRVEEYKVYGTSAIRETRNLSIVLDQIAQRTGLHLAVLSNSEQRFLDYKSVASKGEVFDKIIESRAMIVDIGGGSIQLSLFDNGVLIATQNLRLGVLRVLERLHRLNAGRSQTEGLVDEMASDQLAVFKKLYLKERTVENIIIVDDYLSAWAVKYIGNAVADVAEYDRLFALLRTLSGTDAAIALDLAEEKVPLVYISALIMRRIVELVGAQKVWAPGVSLCDGIAYEYAEKNKLLKGEHDFERDILACAANISQRYMGNKKRGETLEKICLTIYDSMKRVHGLGRRERLYLRLAALLHDCGKYISMVNMGEASYNIVMATEIIGLSHREREMVANIVRFNHSPFEYDGQVGGFGADREAYLIVAKLCAILRIANSLDRSHKQKLKDIRAKLKENQLILTVDTQEDITLEKGSFEERVEFFREVFSVEPMLSQRKRF